MDWLGLYLEEDVGPGDLTSQALFLPHERGKARMVARQAGVAAGLATAVELFGRLDVGCHAQVADGEPVVPGSVLLRVEGPVRGILAAERTALNIVGRMSGIATATRRLMDALHAAGSHAVVAGTRKTTPGFRHYEKEAIRLGGGDPHRMGLFDAMMVKDNHLAAAGGVTAAVAVLRAAHPDKVLEVEVESEEDAVLAAAAGVDWVLIDNQDPQTGRAWAQAVRNVRPETRVEASGGITPASLIDFGWADRISMGSLTHSAASLDVGLDWDSV